MIALKDNDRILLTNKAPWTPNEWGYRPNGITIEEGLSTLDFEIQKKPNFAFDERFGTYCQINGQYHLECSDDHSIIAGASVGEQFNPVQHSEVFNFVTKEIMERIPNSKIEMVGTFHGRGTGIIALSIGETFSIKGDDSPQMTRMLYANPCNGTGRLTLGFHNIRIVCQNTLMAAIKQANGDGFKIKHTKNAEVKCDNALKAIAQASDAALEMRRRSEVLASIGLGVDAVKVALDAIYPFSTEDKDSPIYKRVLALREEVIRQFESGETAQTMRGKTAWSLFNSFTYPIFNAPKITRKTDLAQVAYNGMVGETAYKVRDIFNEVERVAMYAA